MIPRTTIEQQSHGDTAPCKQSYVLMCCVCVCRNVVTTEGVESALHAFNLHTHTHTHSAGRCTLSYLGFTILLTAVWK